VTSKTIMSKHCTWNRRLLFSLYFPRCNLPEPQTINDEDVRCQSIWQCSAVHSHLRTAYEIDRAADAVFTTGASYSHVACNTAWQL